MTAETKDSERNYLTHRLTRVLADSKDMNREYADLHVDFLRDVLASLKAARAISEPGLSAWKDYAEHLECCQSCAIDAEQCDEGHALNLAARASAGRASNG